MNDIIDKKTIEAIERRDAMLREMRDNAEEYRECETCEEEVVATEGIETHDEYFLCFPCAEDYCHRCKECGAYYDNSDLYCPICGAIK